MIMKLICDYTNGVYYWVSDGNVQTTVSPHFDYEADAERWYENLQSHFTKETPNE
jgi:hypothetical protein